MEHADVDAVAIATPPRLQPAIAVHALERGKPVFVEKPLAADLDSAAAMLRQSAGGPPAMIDFGFPEIPPWRKAKALIDEGAIGALRHVVVTWNVENYATRTRHAELEDERARRRRRARQFRQPLLALSGVVLRPDRRIVGAAVGTGRRPGAGDDRCASVAFRSGAVGNLVMSSASYLGSGHRLEFYGEDGTLVLANPTPDYMRGFELAHARRPAAALAPVAVDDPSDQAADGRIASGDAARAPFPRRDRAAAAGLARFRRGLSRAISHRCGATIA